ncbi:hypothetical protein [Rhodoferax sp.]|uniref:hypothetical protein n=1 Tax=Rhodoferax sp. TaxID=50421 RepID=UPI002626E187|nr:hypothetical protein [Rhodoferax sp.]MDD2810332.1 hypothetical protein [Rhodoferax sp.]MDD4944183.1 hypothetical protein [Rhodoferax sp.]
MLLKWIAHTWASSNLRKEEARTQRLLSRYDSEKAACDSRIADRKSDYQRKIKERQEMRNRELQEYIQRMNSSLQAVSNYMPKLDKFQTFTFTCLDSWMKVDLIQQEIGICNKKIEALRSTIDLIDAYITELNKLSQRQGRHVWREMTAKRPLTVSNDYVDKTRRNIDRGSKLSNDEFSNELKRLRSRRDALRKEVSVLIDERVILWARKDEVELVHNANKQTLGALHNDCCDQWNEVLKGFESYYVNKTTEHNYVNQWLRNLKEGGTLEEITEVIDKSYELIKLAQEKYDPIKGDFLECRTIVNNARSSGDYPSNYSLVKSNLNKLRPIVQDQFDLIASKRFLCGWRDELRGYIDKLKRLHPDETLNSICALLLLSEKREVNTWQAFGIKTYQRVAYSNKQRGDQHAAAN